MSALPPRRLGLEEVASAINVAPGTLYNRLAALRDGNRARLPEASLRDVPPMKKHGRKWSIWGPALEDWIIRRERGFN